MSTNHHITTSPHHQITKPLLTTAYFGPVQYYSKLKNTKDAVIEVYDTYMKQTYRNRCNIFSSNGSIALSIPVDKPSGKVLTKDVRISYAENWQKNHFKAIESAYRSSPFYEYYMPEFEPILAQKHNFLIDLNSELHNLLLELLQLDVSLEYTTDYIVNDSNKFADYREVISPKYKKQDNEFNPKPYYQVFADKHGFQPNMSILDLLFNEGPNSYEYL